MKKICVLIIGVLCGSILLFRGAPNVQALWLDVTSVGSPSSPSAEVWLRDRGTSAIGGFDITVTFDQSLLTLAGVSFGSSLGAPDSLQDWFAPPGTGSVNVFEASLLPEVALQSLQSLDFLLFSLQFNAVGTGTSTLSLSNVVLSDPNGDAITLDRLAKGYIEAKPVPEPSALLLFAVGLTGVVYVRRRYRT